MSDATVNPFSSRSSLVAGMLVRLLCVGFTAHILFASALARAQAAPPASHEDEAFDFMNLLSQHGLHNLDDETWNLYGQFTYISSWKLPFQAPYTNANGSINSLVPDHERDRHQKTGSETPQIYRARLFLRQTFGFGGHDVVKTSDPMQLGTVVKSRRLVLMAGNYTFLDVFDRNNVTWDPRQTFFNMAFMTHAAWDFMADARGYSWGGAVELYWDEWALRFGRMAPPQHPNILPIDLQIWKYYGDALELEVTFGGGRVGASFALG